MEIDVASKIGRYVVDVELCAHAARAVVAVWLPGGPSWKIEAGAASGFCARIPRSSGIRLIAQLDLTRMKKFSRRERQAR